MDTTELSKLEQDIHAMISTIEKLRVENLRLNTHLGRYKAEHDRLTRLNNKARLKIHQIIRQLKGEAR